MPFPPLPPIDWPGGLTALRQQAAVFDLLASAVALLDPDGAPVYRNPAFVRLDESLRDSPQALNDAPGLLACSGVREAIATCVRQGETVQLARTFYYSRHITADLTLVLRPVRSTSGVDGVLVHVAEESLAHDDRQLVRLQHTVRELGERIRVLSVDKLGADRLVQALLTHTPFPLVLFNRHRQILQMNRACEGLFGPAVHDAVGATCDRFFDCHERHRGCPLQSAGAEIALEEGQALSPDSTPIPVLHSAVILAQQDEPVFLEVFVDIRARKRAESELHESERRLTTLMSNLPGLVYRCRNDPDWAMEFISDGCLSLTGYTSDDFVLRRSAIYGELIHSDDRDQVWNGVQDALARRVPFQLTYRIVAKDGKTKWVWERGRGIFDEHGTLLFLEGFVTDITDAYLAQAEMRKLSSAIQQTADAVIITDRDGVIEYVNQAFEQTTGYSAAEALGCKPSLVTSGLQSQEFYQQLWSTILDGRSFREVFINRRKDGALYYEEKTITPLRDANGRITHFISTGKDITERMQAQERLHHLAHHDALTELPNRVLFLERLNQALQRSGKSERIIGVMFLDLDRFKLLNDTLGHDVGDRFLKGIAARLRAAVREGDTVARLGGDEFAILLNQVAQPEDITLVANKILRVFAAPFDVGGHQHYLTASIGISLYPNDGADAATLLKHADNAMYRAKDLGKNTYQFYSADMGAQALERLTLETSLRHALARNEFVLHYQPQIDLAAGRLLGLEALLRWQHPDLGLIGPTQFMPLAEETGLINPISEWVLDAAATQARVWVSRRMSLPKLAVNLSGVQFHQTNFVETMRHALAAWGANATQLEFEITESAIMKDAALTAERLKILHGLGARFAIDDFGTGYSSLSYLKRFPITTLKVDKSFVQDITRDENDAEIVRTIIGMAHNLKLKVIAEGVETAEQLDLLRAQGCDAVQGYYFSRPLPAHAIEPWLRTGGRPASDA
jgi:diguanylate cyclase (GGDEF)-like protein/PAS domain S-box-containing protein